jgi:hypothetical protein
MWRSSLLLILATLAGATEAHANDRIICEIRSRATETDMVGPAKLSIYRLDPRDVPNDVRSIVLDVMGSDHPVGVFMRTGSEYERKVRVGVPGALRSWYQNAGDAGAGQLPRLDPLDEQLYSGWNFAYKIKSTDRRDKTDKDPANYIKGKWPAILNTRNPRTAYRAPLVQVFSEKNIQAVQELLGPLGLIAHVRSWRHLQNVDGTARQLAYHQLFVTDMINVTGFATKQLAKKSRILETGYIEITAPTFRGHPTPNARLIYDYVNDQFFLTLNHYHRYRYDEETGACQTRGGVGERQNSFFLLPGIPGLMNEGTDVWPNGDDFLMGDIEQELDDGDDEPVEN